MKVEIDDLFLEQVVAASLKETYKYLGSKQKIPIFSSDPKTDKEEMKRYREAFRLVHNWYTAPSDHIK